MKLKQKLALSSFGPRGMSHKYININSICYIDEFLNNKLIVSNKFIIFKLFTSCLSHRLID